MNIKKQSRQMHTKDGSLIYYEVYGNGFPLVLLHGNGGDGSYFIPQIKDFSTFYQLIVVDSRDHGYSSNRQSFLTFELMADDLHELLNHEKIHKAAFWGFSDGANLALVFAKRYPEQVSHLILNSPNLTLQQVVLLHRWITKITFEFYKLLAPIFNFAKRKKRMTELMIREIGVSKKDLKHLFMPTLLIAGQYDSIKTTHMKWLAQVIPNATFILIKGYGHKVSAAIEAFIQETDRLSYLPVFYEVQQETVMTLHEFGYDFIKMGESALVNLNDFSLSGKRLRGTRSTMNRIKKAGYEFSVIYPPFNKDTMVELKQISDQWLHGRKERGFSLGFFDENYLQRNPIAIVKNEAGEIVSFANIIPSYSNEIGTIDLMRHNPSTAPSGSMDYLFIHLFDYFKEQGIQFFDLGMAPLSKVGQSRKSFIQERIASLVYNFGNRFYSFQGLRDYKEKYASKWVPRYTLYSRDSWIVYVILALLIVDNRTISKN